ncbi:MAG: hypothetical protein HY904_08930 [Deltaproteobacteria bacterium]|nr:hypothetical protein [Deltaproteobacteria bacterium]
MIAIAALLCAIPVADDGALPPIPAEQRLADADALAAAMNLQGAAGALGALADDPTVPPALRAKAALKLGLVEQQRGLPDRAVLAFKAALAQDPSITLPAQAAPEAGALFQQARGELAAWKPPPAPLPAKVVPVSDPALGWIRPTSYAVIGAGGVMLVAGAVVAMGGFVLREYTFRFAAADYAPTLTRALLPVAVAAAALVLLAIPTGGTGLALFFLSGRDGPLRDRTTDTD